MREGSEGGREGEEREKGLRVLSHSIYSEQVEYIVSGTVIQEVKTSNVAREVHTW